MTISLPSRIDKVRFKGRNFYVKRDDLLHPCLSGNKYRKLYSLVQTPSTSYDTVISYGGSQSNAMLSIACLCKAKGWKFHYYTKILSSHLKEDVDGNLARSLAEGMRVNEVPHELFEQKVEELKSIVEEKTLVVSQGGADEIAEEGIVQLAEEINVWKKQEGIEKLSVVLPSGTGTTALYLQAALDDDIELYTSVLVGDEAYQNEQWQRLSKGPYPKILPSDKKRKFAKPYTEYLQMHQELESETGITFDLIYAPKTWMEMLSNLSKDEGEILYIHTGGVSGNKTMLKRYEYLQSRQR
jgi:1-aminocyclopropane-1-carboxylate deaminase/D-cysteine desulfhydrase-like pyridoxal-dependent ACC family enzyme